jgi:PAS domain S-box-containing protein
MQIDHHYLREELYDLFQKDSSLFDFLQLGSLDGIWYWDLVQPEVEWMSPRFWTLLGYDPAERQHLASEWQDIINADDLQMALTNFHKHAANPDHPYDQVVRYRHRDGSTVWVRCRGIIIRDSSGTPFRMLGAHTDLTALKRVEQELQQRTAELEAANVQLHKALDAIKVLEGVLPTCMHCKMIREDSGSWTQMEAYIARRSQAKFSHGICPQCLALHHPDVYRSLNADKKA